MAQKKLTQRQKNSRKVSRTKARRQRYHAFFYRVKIGILGVAIAVAMGGGGYMAFTGKLQTLVDRTIQRGWQATASLGFAVDSVYLDGRTRTPMAEIKKTLNVDVGAPILALSLSELRAKLETIPTVKHAAVERALPDTLMIHITEREPVAIWQHTGKLVLVDDGGTLMPDLKVEDYAGLPLIVGAGAPKHVGEVLAILEKDKKIAPMIQAAVRVGDRRWDIHFRQGLVVKLPSGQFSAAWNRLTQMNADQQILLRAIQTIDMRDDERMYITVMPDSNQPVSNIPTKET